MIRVELNYSKYTGNFNGILTKKELEYFNSINKHAENKQSKIENIDGLSIDCYICVLVYEKSHTITYNTSVNDTINHVNISYFLSIDIKSNVGFQSLLEQNSFNFKTEKRNKNIVFKDFEKVSLKKLHKLLNIM